MIIHYLKIAFRNLWKYRTHSLISVLCLAVGITFYTVMSLFVSRFTGYRDLPEVERRVILMGPRSFFSLDNIDYLHSLHIAEMDSLIVVSFSQIDIEAICFDNHQRELPYMAKFRLANEHYFPAYGLKVIAGNARMLNENEVVIHEKFARRAFGDENPIGFSIGVNRGKEGELRTYRIVGIVSGKVYSEEVCTDIYFPLSYLPKAAFSVETTIKKGISIQAFKERMNQVNLESGNEDSRIWIYSYEDRYKKVMWIELGGLLIGSLILLSGIINFLKFIIQMFYNRQRELAIRKCVGSGMTGLFFLLFAECFCMMTVALFLSMCISELVYTFVSQYMVKDMTAWIELTDVYWIQFKVYWVVLVICLLVCLYPVWRIRHASIINMVMVGTRRHVFRNVMIGVQMATSLFFVGSTAIIALVIDETTLHPVSYISEKEKEHILELEINSMRLGTYLDAILSDVKALPEVEACIQTMFGIGFGSIEQYFNNQQSYHVRIQVGNPDYFRFFKIPMTGKEVEPFSGNYIYVSKKFSEQLVKDSVQGVVKVDNVEYQVAGVYEHLHGETKGVVQSYIGTAFKTNMKKLEGGYVYFRIGSHADTRIMKEKIIAIIRKYVPETLPLEIRRLADEEKSNQSTIMMMSYGIFILAFVSLLVVALSIYSAISMDTVSRQKEVAIRKINGATPRVIAWLFGRIYVLTYLIVFAIVFPLGKQVAIIAFNEFNAPYRWDWVIVIFFGMALLIFMVTAFKIWQIMHINPASIIKKE